jgi:hypothetical protein
MRWALAAVMWVTIVPRAYPDSIWLDYPDDGIQLGAGWDAVAGHKINTRCIESAEEIIEKNQTSYVTIGQISDKSQLFRELNVSASAQAQYLMGAGNAKMKFISSQNVRRETFTVAIYASVTNGPHYLGLDRDKPAALSAENAINASPLGKTTAASHLADSQAIKVFAKSLRLAPLYEQLWHNNRLEFYQKCGTHYVAAFREGGELIGFLSSSDLRADQKSSISMGLSFGAQASSDISQTVNQISSVKTFNIQARKSGGWESPLATDQASLTQALEHLAKDAGEGAHKFQFEAASYSELMNEQDPGDPNVAALDALMRRYWRLAALKSDFLDVDGRRSDYIFNWGITPETFDEKLRTIQNAVDSVTSVVKECVVQRNCSQRTDKVPSPFDWYGYLPIQKRSFPADVYLRDAAVKAQSAVTAYETWRQTVLKTMLVESYVNDNMGCDRLIGNLLFTKSAEALWLYRFWPVVAAFESSRQAYPDALKREIKERSFRVPWRSYCAMTPDPDCIDVTDLRARQESIPISTAGHDIRVSGKGEPGDEATRCDPNVIVTFDANID